MSQATVSAPGPVARSSTRILIVFTAVAALLFAISLGVVFTLVSGVDRGTVNDESFLEIRLAGPLTDAPAVGGFFLEPDDMPPTITEIAQAIRHARDDERIRGLYLVLDAPSLGWAGTSEVRDAIADFRGGGKPCVAYAEVYTTGSWYLATACDHVVMAPSGVGMVTGIAASTTYYVGAMEKLGVKAQMLHVGDFKSAVEPFERGEPSPAAAEAMNLLLDSLYRQMLDGVAATRGRTAAEVQAWIDRPQMSPKRALASGMVDALAFPDAARGHAHRAAEEGFRELLSNAPEDDQDTVDERFTSLSEYLKIVRAAEGEGDDRIAIVYTEGPIVSGEAGGGLFGEQMVADRTVRAWMREILEDDSVKAVVLRVNSPGGSGLASDMIWNEVRVLQAAGKPVVVSMGNYAASGGYFIAAPADWIVAQPNTITGSIGVFGGKMSFEGTYGKLGLTETTFKRGAEADLLSTTSLFSDTGREVYQGFLDDFYELFLSKVVEGRELPRDDVHAVAQGRVWTGEQALERKLVDQLGGLDDALVKAGELAGLESWGVSRWPARKGFLDLLLEDMEQGASVSVDVPGLDTHVLDELLMLDQILDDGGVAALLPGNLHSSP